MSGLTSSTVAAEVSDAAAGTLTSVDDRSEIEPRLVVVHHGSGPERPDLSVIIPAFNEAFRLPAALDGLAAHVDPATTEVIVVDDGSTDETIAVAERARDRLPHLVIVEHEVNRGKGAAVRTGVAASTGRSIAFIDADNATDLTALGPMLERLTGDVAAVFGSRHADDAHVEGSPAIRGLMGRVFNHAVKLAAGTKIRDTQCGAKLFTGAAGRVAFGASRIEGFAFDVDVLRTLLQCGFRVVEHPVHWHYVHGTKVQLLTPLRMLRDIIALRVRPTRPELLHLDTTWSEAIAEIADPLSAAAVPVVGEPCRVLLPGRDRGEAEQIAARLRQAGQRVDLGQSRSWLQESGLSSS